MWACSVRVAWKRKLHNCGLPFPVSNLQPISSKEGLGHCHCHCQRHSHHLQQQQQRQQQQQGQYRRHLNQDAAAAVSIPSCDTSRGIPSCMHTSRGFATAGEEEPVAIDNQSLLEERKFHNLADETIQHIQEKIDDLVEELDIEGFDSDHAEGVLTIKLGTLGTFVINKQTPNRQIWLSSPVSGPARFDWDAKKRRWWYRRTKTELNSLLEKEFKELLGPSVGLSQWTLR